MLSVKKNSMLFVNFLVDFTSRYRFNYLRLRMRDRVNTADPNLSEGWRLEESLYVNDGAEKSARRWSPFQAFFFVFLAALSSWGFFGLLVYLFSR